MNYRTIVLRLIQRHQLTYQHLCSSQRLMPTVDLYAEQLKANHHSWNGRLVKANPGYNPVQLQSESLELAIRDLENYLVAHFQANDNNRISLDSAMAFIRARTLFM